MYVHMQNCAPVLDVCVYVCMCVFTGTEHLGVRSEANSNLPSIKSSPMTFYPYKRRNGIRDFLNYIQ